MLTAKSKRATIDTPNTLLVGAYVVGETAAITATLRTKDNELRAGVAEAIGAPLPALAGLLTETRLICAKHAILMTNDAELLRLLSRPWRYSKAHPADWPAEYMRILLELTRYCLRGSWKAIQVEDLPKARELWQQNYKKS